MSLLVLLVGLMLAQGTVQAQGVTTGAITGTVTDPSGQPLPGIEVNVVNRESGYSNSTLTRQNGQYLMPGLEVGGPYTLTVRALGYADFVRNDVFVRLSQSTRVDAQLSVQAVQLQALDVTVARTADFTPTRQGISVQVSDTLVNRVPTFSRDFIDLVKLAPQVVYPAGGGAASGAGAYNRFNTITIDGANQSERFNLGSTGGVPGGSASGKIVSMDAVKEFRVMFTPTDVRQGNFAGMLVNAVTKSGTNQFRGGASFTYRDNQDIGGLQFVGRDLRASEFQVQQYGFHLGGPIIRDRLHFFIAPELQERTRPAGGPYYTSNGQASPAPSPGAPAVPLDSLNRIAQIMRDQYGFDVGAVTPVDNKNPLTNLFGRLDFQISPDHRLVLRQIYNKSEDDSFSRNIGSFNASPLNQNSGFRFGSNQFSRVATNLSSVAQVYSTFGNVSNELILGYSTIKDERSVPVQAPEIAVGVAVTEGTTTTVRAVTFGTEQFSPGNLLEQDIFEVVNNITIPVGNHTFTFGGRFDHTRIFNNFAQGSFGVYTFPTIAALQNGTPGGYAVGFANSGVASDIPADFRVQVYSLYGQDQWSITDRFTITAGLRADIPHFLDQPSQNDTLTTRLAAAGLQGVRTDAVPSTRVLWSPRFGFNWDPTGDQMNQVRGGVGIYSGPPPYILLGNAYSNTGLGLVRLSCTGTATPDFTVDVNNLPNACRNQPVPSPGQFGTAGVNTIDPDFRFPQYFGVSGGFDRRLPYATVLTVEGLYRRAINGVLVRDLNLRGPRMVNGQPYTDVHGRVLYADTFAANHAVTNTNQRYITNLRGTNFNEGVIDVTNQSEDFNWSVSAQLNRRFSNRFEATLAYTHMQSEDVQSLNSDRAISNWRNARQLATAHETLETTTSVFSRPHRVLAYGTYSIPWRQSDSWKTDVTLYYEGSSGVPLTYVAGGTNGDLNGDGYAGNDPIYIPRNALDTNEIRIGTGVGAAFVQNVQAAQAFERFIAEQECLNSQRGQIMERNSCRSPFQHRMDVSVRQNVPTFRGQQVSLQLDFFNFPNFLTRDWGINRLPTLSPTFNDQRALVVSGRNPGPINQSLPTFSFDNRLYGTNPANPNFGAPLPFQGRTASTYQIQLTARYNF
jgi:hypothetical protein